MTEKEMIRDELVKILVRTFKNECISESTDFECPFEDTKMYGGCSGNCNHKKVFEDLLNKLIK